VGRFWCIFFLRRQQKNNLVTKNGRGRSCWCHVQNPSHK
jgi:hypothetical protein